jgi:hypothetical protein
MLFNGPIRRYAAAGKVDNPAKSSCASGVALNDDARSNLTFVSWLCNNHKSYCEFDDGFGLLNPYGVDPQSYLRFFGTMLSAALNEKEGNVRSIRSV